MLLRLFVFIAIIGATIQIAHAADDPYHVLLRDSRIIRDVATWDASKVRSHPKRFWVVGEVIPSTDSGTVQRAQRDAAGKVVKSPDMIPTTKVVSGAFKTIDVLSDVEKDPIANYHWEVPGFLSNGAFLRLIPNTGSAMDASRGELYDPFTRGGSIICHIHKDIEWPNKANPIFLIPTEWSQFVLPVIEYQSKDPSLFRTWPTGNITPANQALLKTLLQDRNPFLSVAAWRLLTSVGKLEKEVISEMLLHTNAFRQAVITYLLMIGTKPLEDDVTMQLIEIIQRTDHLEKLHGLALGAYTAHNADQSLPKGNGEFGPSQVQKNSLMILKEIAVKKKELQGDRQEDADYISLILKIQKVKIASNFRYGRDNLPC